MIKSFLHKKPCRLCTGRAFFFKGMELYKRGVYDLSFCLKILYLIVIIRRFQHLG